MADVWRAQFIKSKSSAWSVSGSFLAGFRVFGMLAESGSRTGPAGHFQVRFSSLLLIERRLSFWRSRATNVWTAQDGNALLSSNELEMRDLRPRSASNYDDPLEAAFENFDEHSWWKVVQSCLEAINLEIKRSTNHTS